MPEFSAESVAFVTGGASGIGLATVKVLLTNGITKLSLIDINPSTLSEATSSLAELFPSASILSLKVNCSVEAEVEDAVAKTVEKFGRLDFCCNAAAVALPAGKINVAELDLWESIIGINAKGVWLCERAQIKQLMKQDERAVSTGLPLKTRGAIVNVGSLAGQVAIGGMTPYVMSKHAVLGLCKADGLDYATEGVRVNCVQPGPVKTPMMQAFFEGPESLALSAIGRSPMKRWADPEEIAHAISFLLSDKASFITGTSLNVDGGYGAM